MKPINVLSLFDGISCGMVALERAGIPVNKYVAYEINEDVIKVSKNNYPQIKHRGDVKTANWTKYKGCDLLIGGSPCQDISHMKKNGKGLKGEKSSLFYDYLKALKIVKPKYFLLENVAGRKEAIDEITESLGVNPIKIDSKLVSGQKRRRLYGTNIPNVSQPNDKGIMLRDILQPFEEAKIYKISDGKRKWLSSDSGKKCVKMRYATIDGEKAQCLTARAEKSWNCNYVTQNGIIRNLSPIEYERLQTLPDNYTKCIEDDERYVALGNAWTVDVIAHIFKYLKYELEWEEAIKECEGY